MCYYYVKRTRKRSSTPCVCIQFHDNVTRKEIAQNVNRIGHAAEMLVVR